MVLMNKEQKSKITAAGSKAFAAWTACTGASMVASTIFNIANGIMSMINGESNTKSNYASKGSTYIRVSPNPYQSAFTMWI